MRFSVSVAVLASPLVCLLAVLALDDSAAPPPDGPPRVAARVEPVATGSFDPGGGIRLDPVLRRWRTALRLTPQQAGVWAGLEPGTARALAAGPRVAREICAGERADDPDRRALAARRRGEWQARFTPLRGNWDRLAQELSPRQGRRYRALIAPRLDAAFSVRCPAPGDAKARG